MERLDRHPILGFRDRKEEEASFTFNGKQMRGLKGEPIAAALLASGVRVLRRHEESGLPRGLYCAIGHCMECRLTVEGKGTVRSCLAPLEEGMRIVEGPRLSNEITGRKLP